MVRKRQISYRRRKELAALRSSRETAEERALRLEKNRIRSRNKRACETAEETATRLAQQRARNNHSQAYLKQKAKSVDLQTFQKNFNDKVESENKFTGYNKKQIAANNAYIQLEIKREEARKRTATRRSQETPEERALRLEKNRIRTRNKRACETPEETATRLAQQRARNNQREEARRKAATRRSQETPEQRVARLEKCRIRTALVRADESEEKRAARLAQQRTRVRAVRAYLKQKRAIDAAQHDTSNEYEDMIYHLQLYSRDLNDEANSACVNTPVTDSHFEPLYQHEEYHLHAGAQEVAPNGSCLMESQIYNRTNILVECDVTIEEDDEELFQCEPGCEAVPAVEQSIPPRLKQEPVFETALCHSLPIKQEVEDIDDPLGNSQSPPL